MATPKLQDLISIPAYARSRNMDVKTLRLQMKKAGLRACGRVLPANVDKIFEGISKNWQQRPDDPEQGKPGHVAFSEAERRHKVAKAEQEELKLQKIQGTLVTRDAVKAATFDMIRRARDKFLNIPARLSGVLAAESDQARIFALLTKEIHQALEDLSS